MKEPYSMQDEEKTKEHLIKELLETRQRLAQLEEREADRNQTEEALRKSEERYKKMVNAVTAYIYTVEVSEGQATSTWHSRGCFGITGFNPEDYVSNPYLWRSMIYPDDWEIVETSIKEILNGNAVPPVEHRIIRRDGTLVWIRNTMVPYYDEKGLLIKYDGLIEDISGRKQTEEALRESEEKFRAIAQTAVDAIILADSEGNIIFCNPSTQRIFGYKEEEMLGKPLTILMPEPFRGDHENGLERIKRTGKSKYVGSIIEMQGLRKDRNVFPIDLSVSMWRAGQQTFYSGIIRDITKRKNLERDLEQLASTDRLTQAFNRTKFQEVIRKELERAKRYSHPLSMIMFDIDHFKQVNDTHGHIIGDYVLQTLTQIVRKNLREIDFLVRWGGEEFVIIAPETDVKRAEVLAERIRKATENYSFDTVGAITISLGLTQMKDNDTEDTLIKKVDDAMYLAKQKGRNRVEVSV
jgi:diguanylate cyclase (GGDEF)-like protein/PAS domain S-box-containing protein